MSTSNQPSLLRLQQIYQSLKPGVETFQVEMVKRIQNASEAIDFLHSLEDISSYRWSNKYVVLDCPTEMAKEVVVTHVRDITLGKRTYHYLLSGLIMDDRWESEVIEYGAINITGFRIVESSRRYVKDFLEGWRRLDPNTSQGAGRDSISAQAALMYDAVFVLVEAFNKLLRKKPDMFRNNLRRGQIFNNGTRGIDCNTSRGWVTPWEHGDKISRFLRKRLWRTNLFKDGNEDLLNEAMPSWKKIHCKKIPNSLYSIDRGVNLVELEGLTGEVRFNDDGRRMNYTLHVVEMTVNSAMVKVSVKAEGSTAVPSSNLC
ncbi:hypothetical protein J6590_053619 [Homalodisca vitripennis]|nr:hypothetical protein J6590_053619 [Homalodisca vitripennis]